MFEAVCYDGPMRSLEVASSKPEFKVSFKAGPSRYVGRIETVTYRLEPRAVLSHLERFNPYTQNTQIEAFRFMKNFWVCGQDFPSK